MIEIREPTDKAVLVAAPCRPAPDALHADDDIDELARLGDTAGVRVVGPVIQRIDAAHPRFYLGEGKVAEVRELARSAGATLIIFDEELTPAQGMALEDALRMRLMDRTEVILGIFARRARSREAMLQVELPRSDLTIGGIGTYVRAWSERARLSPGVPRDEYSLLEKTVQFGALVTFHVTPRVHAEATVLRVERIEESVNRSTPSKSVDFDDRGWSGRLVVGYLPHTGLIADIGALFDARDVLSGVSELPDGAARGGHHYRPRWNAGLRFGKQAAFLIGTGIDLDGDGVGRRFDGARGRFALFW